MSKIFSNISIAWKVSKYGVISGPYFPAFGLNTERYKVSAISNLQYVKTKLRYDTNFRIWIGKNKSSKLIQLFQAISHTIWSLCELDRTYWNEERAGTSWNHLELPVETTWNKLEPRGTIWNQQRTSKKTNFIGDYCARKILLPNEIQHYQQLCHKELHLVDVVKVFHTRPCFIYPFNRRAIITFNESTAHAELIKQCVNRSKIPCWKLMK